ncbi:MAG: hypothetical protein JKY63_00945 [Rhodobiaceae bacterium]|nr:hypothetical protein [Rhodobiaceae bacterium]
MNLFALSAAGLLAVGFGLHVVLGRAIHQEMQEALDGFPKALDTVTWHAVSLWLSLHLVLALAAVYCAHPWIVGALVLGAIHALSLGALCLSISLKLCKSWTAMRQSYLFFMIAGALAGAAVTVID